VPYLEISGEDEPIEFLFTLGDKYGLIARGNLHTLRGAPKTGKSAAGLALIAAALKGEFIGIKANQDNLAVLWIDTEQDKNTLRQKARAVLDMAGLDASRKPLKLLPCADMEARRMPWPQPSKQ
jgi:KaiC/GvpD/RAD55 family RecA-like ATPase